MRNRSLSDTFDWKSAESKWYAYWLEHNYFHAEDENPEKKPFCIVIPPPNVTGILHMGHALNNTLQDIMTRFRRMQGYNTLWMPGMDHAGIATQNVVEQELAREGLSRHDLGREKFIKRVWQWKEKYGGIIIEQLKRLGASCDWERQRFTMDEGLSRAVREVFVRLYNDGLIYQGDYIVNWCPRCHTAISDLEVEYVERQGSLWYIRYPYVDGPGEVIVATTRPETMLGDTAVAVNPEDERYKNIVGRMVLLPLMNRPIPVIADDYVSMEFGTGAVKITPGSDPADFAMAQRHHLPIIKIMDGNAIINEEGGPYQGLDREECRSRVVEDLNRGGYLVRVEPYAHNVGRCYRCKTVIEPYVSKQWFVKVEPFAKEAIKAVVTGRTRIIPSMWEATYFDWLNNIRDWCISRQIWWGHRIPVWYCDRCGEKTVRPEDPDRCAYCGNPDIHQDEDVLDTWFSSALWPFSTLGWPEETKALKTFYPTSLLITGFDILFFWVARMMMMGLYVMKDVPFRDVYLHALVRDERGEKMSKSRGNSIDPIDMIEKYGADAFRFTLAAFTAQGRDVRMSEERIEGYKFFVNKIWNAAKFTLLNLHDYDPQIKVADTDLALPDRWILSRLRKAIEQTTRALDEYKFNEAASTIYQFIWHELCDWYVELIKPAIYGRVDATHRRAAQQTLYQVMKASLELLHPFMPFVTEEIWQRLVGDTSSVMITPYPEAKNFPEDGQAEAEMGLLMEVITRIRNVRGEMGIAPSKKLSVLIPNPPAAEKEIITRGMDYITNLANLTSLTITADETEPRGAATTVAGNIKIFVLLEGAIDPLAEKARLEKELVKIKKDLAIVTNKLSNPQFHAKASPEVVSQEREKQERLSHRQSLIEAALKKVEELIPG
ncbi:MAG TPA: valine--tRNA ligase [Syntrophales bacterium]|nr:valine--tRNA ligase [Syntrophales bacterium]HOL58673.1 valine--tRNA ligase [Syntrophales bacterium]HPO35039.1 valine--tRNA ligase [Syntrophales bacterium]